MLLQQRKKKNKKIQSWRKNGRKRKKILRDIASTTLALELLLEYQRLVLIETEEEKILNLKTPTYLIIPETRYKKTNYFLH